MWVILNNKEKLLFDNFAEAKSKFNSLISSHMKDNPDVYFNGMPIPLGSYFNYLFECNQPIDDVYDYTNNILLCLSEGVALNNIIDLKYYDDHEFGKVYIESNKNYFVASVDDDYISLSYSVNNDPYATYRFTSKQSVCSSKNISDIGKMVCKGIILYYDSGVRFDKRSLDDFNEHSQIITSVMYKKNLGIIHYTDMRNNAYVGNIDCYMAETILEQYKNNSSYCMVCDSNLGWIFLYNDYFEALKDMFMYSQDSIETYRKWNAYTHFYKK